MKMTHAVIPLIGAKRTAGNIDLTRFLGSATIIDYQVCTCAHVIESINFETDIVLSKWVPEDPSSPWVVFTNAKVHPRYDFAILKSNQIPSSQSLMLRENLQDMGMQVYAVGYHDDGVVMTSDGKRNINLAPRSFFGNIVRFHQEPNNKSSAVCELSFPTLSGFSGAPVLNSSFDKILGMVYGNIEQKIQVHSKYELREGQMEFSETVNRILELGLFHSADSIKNFLADLK